MKKKNGFTLIELLAVIVILAIIALIAVPQVIKIINKSRLSAAEDSTYGIVDSAEKYSSSFMLQNHGNYPNVDLEFSCSNNNCKLLTEINGYDMTNLDSIEYDGKKATGGNVVIKKDGNVEVSNIIFNGFTCNYPVSEKAKCYTDEELRDMLEIKNISFVNTSSSIKVMSNIVGIPTNYEYSIDDGDYTVGDNNQYTFENLNSGQEYKICVKISNSKKNAELCKNTSTSSITTPKPSLSVSGTTYTEINDVSFQFESGEYINEYSLDNGATWSLYNGPISVSKNGTTVIARSKDSSGNVSIVATVTIENIGYPISYDLSGGIADISNQTKIQGTELLLTSIVPEKSGYLFIGWSDDKNNLYSSGGTYSLDNSTTLIAQYAVNTYSIKYHSNDGNDTVTTISANCGESTNLAGNIFTSEVRTLLGWSTDPSATEIEYSLSQNVSSLSSTYDDEIDLYAVWEIGTYNITFDSNGGSGNIDAITANFDENVTLPYNTYTRTGYTFKGWATTSNASTATYSEGSSVKNLTKTNGATVTLYALWQQQCYYYAVGGGNFKGKYFFYAGSSGIDFNCYSYSTSTPSCAKYASCNSTPSGFTNKKTH